MASLSLAHASLFSKHPTPRMLNHHPVFSSSFTATPSSFSGQFLTLRSSNYKTRIVFVSRTTSQLATDDQKYNSMRPNENKVVEISSWIDYLPEQIQPFAKLARVEKPIGSWLLFFPFAWSTGLAASSGSLPDFKTLAVLGCATPLLRGAGCTINDFLDRDLDKLVI